MPMPTGDRLSLHVQIRLLNVPAKSEQTRSFRESRMDPFGQTLPVSFPVLVCDGAQIQNASPGSAPSRLKVMTIWNGSSLRCRQRPFSPVPGSPICRLRAGERPGTVTSAWAIQGPSKRQVNLHRHGYDRLSPVTAGTRDTLVMKDSINVIIVYMIIFSAPRLLPLVSACPSFLVRCTDQIPGGVPALLPTLANSLQPFPSSRVTIMLCARTPHSTCTLPSLVQYQHPLMNAEQI